MVLMGKLEHHEKKWFLQYFMESVGCSQMHHMSSHTPISHTVLFCNIRPVECFKQKAQIKTRLLEGSKTISNFMTALWRLMNFLYKKADTTFKMPIINTYI